MRVTSPHGRTRPPADLDPVTPQHPVVLSGAWRAFGVGELPRTRAGGHCKRNADPPGGRIVRDAEGRPTGLLLEEAQKLVTAVIPNTNTAAARERRIRVALQQYVRWGLTGVHDAGTELEDIAILKRLLENGELPIRVYAMAYGDAAIEHYLKNGPEIGYGDGRLTIRSFKIYVDGALGSRGASCRRRTPMHLRHQACRRCRTQTSIGSYDAQRRRDSRSTRTRSVTSPLNACWMQSSATMSAQRTATVSSMRR